MKEDCLNKHTINLFPSFFVLKGNYEVLIHGGATGPCLSWEHLDILVQRMTPYLTKQLLIHSITIDNVLRRTSYGTREFDIYSIIVTVRVGVTEGAFLYRDLEGEFSPMTTTSAGFDPKDFIKVPIKLSPVFEHLRLTRGYPGFPTHSFRKFADSQITIYTESFKRNLYGSL